MDNETTTQNLVDSLRTCITDAAHHLQTSAASSPAIVNIAVIDCEPDPYWHGDGCLTEDELQRYNIPEEHGKDIYIRSFAPLFNGRAKFHVFKAYKNDLPQTEKIINGDYDAVLIGGSHYSVYEEDVQSKFLNSVFDLIRLCVDHSIKVVGICFGCQCIGHALGGEVGRNPSDKFMFRSETIRLESSGNEEIAKFLGNNSAKSVKLYELHGDCVLRLPESSVLIGTSDATTNEIFLAHGTALAIQGHPEITVVEMLEHCLPHLDDKRIITAADAVESLQIIKDGLVATEESSHRVLELIANFISGDKIQNHRNPDIDVLAVLEELERLREENARLRAENERLRKSAEQASSVPNGKIEIPKKKQRVEDDLPEPARLLLLGRGTATALSSASASSSSASTGLILGAVQKNQSSSSHRIVTDHAAISDVHAGGNILCCRAIESGDARIVFSSGAKDNTILATDLNSKQVLASLALSAPCVSMDIHPTATNPILIAAGLLDGQTVCAEFDLTPKSFSTNSPYPAHSKHTKNVVRIKWSPCGAYLATSSRDHVVRVSNWKVNGSQVLKDELQQDLTCTAVCEAFDFIRLAKNELYLVITVRDDYLMKYIPVMQPGGDSILDFSKVKEINMNANGDEISSFAALDMVSFPSSAGADANPYPFILVATDKGQIILFQAGTPIQLRVFEGHVCDEYSKPALVWHPSGNYVACTSEVNGNNGYCIYKWELSTAKTSEIYVSHRGSIRDLCYVRRVGGGQGQTEPALISASFDKTVRVWATQ